jgi:uncharacterized protein
MKQKPQVSAKPERWYRGDQVPMAAIRKYARQVAEQFKPDKIILFGSHAYGTPNEDSDVDLLVVMPAWNQLSKAAQICTKLDAPFPLDLIVRTPDNLNWRLAERESFHTEIITRGKVLYEKGKSRMAAKGGKRLSASDKAHKRA